MCDRIERAAIKIANFDPDEPEHFWTHMILEVAIHASVAHSYYNKDTYLPMWHPCAEEQRWNPSGRDAYVRYKFLTTMYGPDKDNLKRYQRVHGNFSYWMMRDSSVIGYVPVLLPTKDEGKMYLDLTFPIRGIFFPLVHKATARYNARDLTSLKFKADAGVIETLLREGNADSDVLQTMCKYVRLDFKRLAVKIPFAMSENEKILAQVARNKNYMDLGPIYADLTGSGDQPNIMGKASTESTSQGAEPLDEYNALCLDQDVQFGLNYQPKWTIEFDIVRLVILLAIPRKDRNPDDDPYKYLQTIEALTVRTPTVVTLETNMEDETYADLAKVLKITQGVSFEYSKAEDLNFFPNLLKGHLNTGKVTKGITRNSKKIQFKVTKTAKETYLKGSS
ncbi:MAG: hypothetical protein Q9213_004196 [Squamulea squamosa]